MKKILLPAILFFAGLILTVPTSAAGEGTVTATVTPEVVSVTVSPTTTIGYGTHPLGTTDIVTKTPSVNQNLDAVNTGTINETFYIRSDDATAGASTWTLAATQGANQYVHKFGEGLSPTYVALTKTATDNLLGASPVTPSSIRSFRLRLSMPTSIAGVFGEYITTVTVVATAAL